MAKPKWKVLDTYTIRGTNVSLRARDCVLLKPDDINVPPYVARVEEIYRESGEVKIYARWFYRPDETRMGPLKFIGAKEVFYSDDFTRVSVKTIEGKCNIHSFKSYTKLQPVTEEDYYCRFKYDGSTGSLVPENVTVYCKCETPSNPDDFMIECDVCYEWYHPGCIGMTIEDARKEAEHFICSECLQKKVSSK